MPDSCEEKSELPSKSKPQEEHGFPMDFDIYLESSSWPLDHTPSASNPMSPFIITTSSEQPFSPLWAFSDVEDDHRHVRVVAGDNTNTNTAIETENPVENDDNKKIVSPPFVPLPPIKIPDGYCLIKERMTQALRHFKQLTEQNFLAQVWAPVRNGNRYALTTSGQPFVLDPHSNGLHQYRTVSLMYMFPVDGENDEILGLPGRVFQQKLPEWTPNVQYYTSREYSRRNHAQHYNVRGTLALPVFESPGQSCVGVLELIMTSEKVNYAPEVDKVCKALEAVNLRSSEILEHPFAQICNEGRQNALAEILEILTVVCETHNLPLAQTWVPCRHRSVLANGGGLKKSCSSFDGHCMGRVCMSASDVAFYVIDAYTWGFHDACAEHHLQQGQGVAGRAFLSHNMSFCGNITQFCKTDYPLVHYALMFGLTSCFAICLQSSHTGSDDYVLEFFLPPSITNFYEQKDLLGSILATMKQNFQSLKVAAGVELEEGCTIEVVEPINERIHLSLESVPVAQSAKSPPPTLNASLNKDDGVPQGPLEQQMPACLDDINAGGNLGDNAGGSTNPMTSLDAKIKKKPSERKRGKAEKMISLEVLQRYFSGSLKDAAKSLGVCPTTMKRICRQHGISRWPSRKINKVNRSLSKLKCVIESVQGAEGAFALNSVNKDPLPIAAGSFTEPCTSKMFNRNASLSIQPSKTQMNENDLDTSRVSETNRQVRMQDQLLEGEQSPEKVIHEEGWSTQEVGTKDPEKFRNLSGSSEDSANPHSHDSCHGSPPNEISPANIFRPFNKEKSVPLRVSAEPTMQPTNALNYANAYTALNVERTEPREPFGRMLLEGVGSSKDLRNLCPLEDQALEACGVNPLCHDLAPKQCMMDTTLNSNNTMIPFAPKKEMKSVTIKATYKEDIIRFRVSLNCGIVELQEEISKRLKLEIGAFDIKYLDDDNEWVLISCDADLQECMDVLTSSGSNMIRLVVHDTVSILGSSCESSGN
ncbi:protein NLP6-like isoform X1 [Arachis stenosperma]|uniref:protein NLP6-like isoform X1 n=1 Tax=Arachis stenosperma TaxID=217475 RepID=UPI0025ACD21E|nr:protein NLP6-like isoform X1 [Arachis stenosperma]